MDCRTDVVFVLDESASVGEYNFGLIKSFLSQLVGKLDMDSGNTRVGVVTYSAKVESVINLNAYTSVAGLQSAIFRLSYARDTTNTAAALAYVRTGMLTSAAGDRSDVPNVVIVLTDGVSMDKTDTQVCFIFLKIVCHASS